MIDAARLTERRLLITQQQLANALARVAELEAIITLSQEQSDSTTV